jgi:hypothetical protein
VADVVRLRELDVGQRGQPGRGRALVAAPGDEDAVGGLVALAAEREPVAAGERFLVGPVAQLDEDFARHHVVVLARGGSDEGGAGGGRGGGGRVGAGGGEQRGGGGDARGAGAQGRDEAGEAGDRHDGRTSETNAGGGDAPGPSAGVR